MNVQIAVADTTSTDYPPGAYVRLFFALVPDPGVCVALGELARTIARASRGRVVAAQHLHLTLAFLGDVPATLIPALRAVGDAMPHTGAVLRFDTLGAWRASGVAWVAPSVLPAAIVALHAALRAALAAAGFTLDTRALRPHITLARRCMQPLPRTRCPPVRWQVDQLCLVGSELHPEGPIYRDIAKWPLTIVAAPV